MAKPMTPAEYAAHAENVDSQQRPTVIKTLKSGSVFELRKPDLQRMVILGVIPQSLLEEGVKQWERSGIKAKAGKREISSDAVKGGLIVMREVVAEACVMPPFNETTAKVFLQQDFNEIFYWAMGHEEGDAAKGVRKFPKTGKRLSPHAVGADREKLRPETISTAEN